MMEPMTGRLLALCGWAAWQVGRPFRGSRLPARILAAILVLAALAPIVIPQLEPQPEDAGVQQIFDQTVTEPDGWVRLRGRVTPLNESPTGDRGNFALLVDEVDRLRAVVLRADDPIPASDSTAVTGHLVTETAIVEEQLPIEATVAGTPPRIVIDRVVELDASPMPVRVTPWPLAIPPLLLAAVLLIGSAAGYPVFRPTSEVDVLSGPLNPGERVPAAYGGRLGPNVCPLADPGGVLLLVTRTAAGSRLTAQPLAEDGGVAPKPVTIGGGWTSGRIGYVHTASESVPALVIRSEMVDATFLFARTAERDRVAALISVER